MKRLIRWEFQDVLFVALLLVLALAPLFVQAETGNQAFTQLPAIRASGISDRADPNIATALKIKMPTGSLTARTDSLKIAVPLWANTATLTILGGTTPVGSRISTQVKGATPDMIIQLKGKPAIIDATAIPLDCSIPTAATTDIFYTGKYVFPVEAGGEVVVSASHVSNASVNRAYIRWGTAQTSIPVTRIDLSFGP